MMNITTEKWTPWYTEDKDLDYEAEVANRTSFFVNILFGPFAFIATLIAGAYVR